MTAKKSAIPASNPFEDDKDEIAPVDETPEELPEPEEETADEPAAPVEESLEGSEVPVKPKRKRRTKAEIEAEKAKDDEGDEPETIDFSLVNTDKLPLSAQSGQVVGSVDLNQGAVPTLNISLQNWIGAPIIHLAASQISDVEDVLKELKKQAKAAFRDE